MYLILNIRCTAEILDDFIPIRRQDVDIFIGAREISYPIIRNTIKGTALSIKNRILNNPKKEYITKVKFSCDILTNFF